MFSNVQVCLTGKLNNFPALSFTFLYFVSCRILRKKKWLLDTKTLITVVTITKIFLFLYLTSCSSLSHMTFFLFKQNLNGFDKMICVHRKNNRGVQEVERICECHYPLEISKYSCNPISIQK